MDERRYEQVVLSVCSGSHLNDSSSRHCNYSHPSTNVTSFSNTANSHVVAASTSNMELLYINSTTGSVARQVPTPSIITQLEPSHSLLLSGSADGYLRTHDYRTSTSRSGGAEGLVRAHSNGILG